MGGRGLAEHSLGSVIVLSTGSPLISWFSPFFDETETQRGHDCLPRVTGLGMAESCLTQFLSFQCFIVHTCLSPDPFPWTKACLPRCGWVKTWLASSVLLYYAQETGPERYKLQESTGKKQTNKQTKLHIRAVSWILLSYHTEDYSQGDSLSASPEKLPEFGVGRECIWKFLTGKYM